MALATRFRAFLNHPAGPKTIFFWAPTFKWGLVIAGLADINRPAEKLSLNQSGALAATGIIWSRYSLVIIPVNYNLFSVNMFVAWTGLYQLYRIARHRYGSKEDPPVSKELEPATAVVAKEPESQPSPRTSPK